MKIYLAGPDVFLPDALQIGRRKAELLITRGRAALRELLAQLDVRH